MLGKKFIRNLIYPLDLWRAGHWCEWRHLRWFERSQYLSAEELRALQLERLKALIDHAYRRCPYYRSVLEKAGILPSDICRLEDWRALPVLEKQAVQQEGARMVAEGWPVEDLVRDQTGGSTGTPVEFYYSRDRLRSRDAATKRHDRWAGLDVGDKVALLWGAPRDCSSNHRWSSRLRNRILYPRLWIDTACLTEARLAECDRQLKRFRPKVILAYARAMSLLARYFKARGVCPYQPHAIITSAEVLELSDRAVIEDVFGCPVFNRYGSRETSIIASQCEAHGGLHTMAEGLYVEIESNGTTAGPGQRGTILITDLLNLAMPLIRYRIGDIGSWAAGSCPCGRQLPRLADVAGRSTDFLVGTDGRLVSGVFLATYVVAQRPSLGQAQIYQDRPGRILYRLKPGPSFHEKRDLPYLRETSRRYLGATAQVDVEFVEELAREPSGKFLFSRSSVVPDFAAAAPFCPTNHV